MIKPETYAKAFYCFFFAALASLMPYLPLYYRGLGLSETEIGLLLGVSPLVVIVAAALWGSLCDVTQRHRPILLFVILGCIASVLGIRSSVSFLGLLPVVMLFAFFKAPINPVIDNAVMTRLGDRSEHYGKIRFWGAIGWGLCSPAIGYAVQHWGIDLSFDGYILFMVACFVVTLRIPMGAPRMGRGILKGLTVLLRNFEWTLFLLLVLFAGIGMAVVHSYLFLFMKDIGAGEGLMGIALTVSTGSEVVVFLISHRLLRRLGTFRLLIVSMAANVVRLFAYSIVSSPLWVLAIQPLHGIAFAGLLTASVTFVNRAAPAGMGATAQGILASVTWGFGAAIGSLGGGALFELVGPFLMFRLTGGLMMVVMAVIYFWIRRTGATQRLR